MTAVEYVAALATVSLIVVGVVILLDRPKGD